MTKKLTLLLFTGLILASPVAHAGGTDLLGLYFEPQYRQQCAEGVPAFSPLRMYLAYVDPAVAEVTGFECGITWSGSDVLYTSGTTWCGVTLEAYQLGELNVACGVPLACTETTVLMTIDWFYTSVSGEMIVFYLGDSAGTAMPTGTPKVRLTDGTLMPVGVDELWMGDGAAAGMTGWNDVCSPLAAEQRTWDAVKSLYR